MALRMRNTITNTAQENVNVIGKAKMTTGLTKRNALGEIGNVQTRRVANINKDAVKKTEAARPNILKKETVSTSSLTQNTKFASQTQSLKCKSSTLLEPSKVVFKPPVSTKPPATVGPSSLLIKSRSRLTLKSCTSTGELPKPKSFAPTRIQVPVFPENSDFTDIDKETETSPIFLGEYAGDIYAFMQEMELKFLVDADFLRGQLVNSKMRALVVDWLVDVQQQYSLLHETLHLAVGIFDRFLLKHRIIEKTQLQLVGITATWIAAKYEELFSPELENFVYITDRTYKSREFIKMEELIHKTLDFCYGQPLSIHFLRRYTNASKTDAKHHTSAKFFLELALVSYSMRSLRPSMLAAVALYTSFCVLNDGGKCGRQVWPNCLVFYSTYTYDDIKKHVPSFARMILEAEKSKLQAVQKKYSSSKHLQVGKLIYLRSEILKTLIGADNEK